MVYSDCVRLDRLLSARETGQERDVILSNPPPVWVQMSTEHIQGQPPEVVCDESAAFGYGMAPFVAQAREAAYREARVDSQRGVELRTSIVIGKGGGALKRLALLTRLGLGGTVASGTQGMSWLHIADMTRLMERALADPNMSGVHIASAPKPVSKRAFTKSLRKTMGTPIGLPAFGWMVRLGAQPLRLLACNEGEMANLVRELSEWKLDRFGRARYGLQVVQGDPRKIGNDDVARDFLYASVIVQILDVANGLRVRLGQIAA